MTYIINLTLEQGIFPDSLKIAKVIPIFKQGSRLLCNNYRPISVLPALSKIFERCILNQLTFYFTIENILIPKQYGFRSDNTTTDCLVDLIDEITLALDEGCYAVSLFLDLSKAFDTVNHSILLSKLNFYGIRDVENQWFRSYLIKRKQRVYVNGAESSFLSVNSGVPQGSILGPFLFLVYINDIVNATNYFSLRLFADDTSLTATGRDLDALLHLINSELPAIYDWLCSNKLTLNLSKTKYIVFQPRQKLNYNLYTPLKLADQYLEQSHSVNYLGLIIDCSLSWHHHIDSISSKISKSINIIAKLKRHVPNKSLTSIYYALIYPYLTYGCVLWGNNYEAAISQVVKLQNKALRIINEVPLREHITPHYVNLGLIKFPDIVKLKTCQLFYDLIVDNKPSNLTLSFVSEQHNYTTRSTFLQYLNPSSFRTNIRKFCPTIIGCYYWNDIPLFIRSLSNKHLFKRYLFQNYFAQY